MNIKRHQNCFSLFIGVLALCLSSVAAAQALTPDQLTKRMQDAGSRLEELQQEVGRLGRLVDNKAVLELFQRVDLLADELSQLRGDMEQQGNELGEIKKRQRELYQDVDRRMRDLERRTGSATSSNDTVGEPSPSSSTSLPTPANSVGAGDTTENQAQSRQILPATNAEKLAYQAAFDTLKEGRYQNAKSEFKGFLQKYPSSGFAGNAQYWLGEANYVTREFEQAIIEFKLVISRYSDSTKVPDALLKLGYTYYELQQYDQARQVLVDLRNRFPKSTAFRLAGQRLERIRKEGL